MQQLRTLLGRIFGKADPATVTRQQREAILVGLAEKLSQTRDVELSCDEAFDLLDRYTELVVEGVDPKPILPEVEHHLSMCKACYEEFDALLTILRAD